MVDASLAGSDDSALPNASFKKIIVAIHGIGSQQRNDTIRSVARRFGTRRNPPLPELPLGFFHGGKGTTGHVVRLDVGNDDTLHAVGFAEVFWANVPREVEKEDDTLEESKAWAATVIGRVQETYNDIEGPNKPRISKEDFDLAGGVLDEIIETVHVLENLVFLAEKASVFKFDLASLLRAYIGDVQIVTEFEPYRRRIVYLFHSAMAKIHEMHPDAEIYIVAHSEGTVVSFLALLEALSKDSVVDPGPLSVEIGKSQQPLSNGVAPAPPAKSCPSVSTDWIGAVRGYMTIGSPIDKHLIMWPKLWQDLRPETDVGADGLVTIIGDGSRSLRLPHPIKWRNYYDFGDPIGFRLDTAREFLDDRHCKAFEFDPDKHDIGFSRSWLPGKAHNDYWSDKEVFGHFIDDVVEPKNNAVKRPSDKLPQKIFSLITPYVMALLLHIAAAWALVRAVKSPESLFQDTAQTVSVLGLLLASATVAARIPRLAKKPWYSIPLFVWSWAAFLTGAVVCWWCLPEKAAQSVEESIRSVFDLPRWDAESTGKLSLVIAAAFVSITGWVAPRKPRWARRTLLLIGSATIALMIAHSVGGGLTWQLVLAGLAFLYLWWLGILLFDLTFVWHRYVRESAAVKALGSWHSRGTKRVAAIERSAAIMRSRNVVD